MAIKLFAERFSQLQLMSKIRLQCRGDLHAKPTAPRRPGIYLTYDLSRLCKLFLIQINGGCESYKLIVGMDEMAIPAEMGLYFDFNVTSDGIPYGCPGFERFNPTYWNTSMSM